MQAILRKSLIVICLNTALLSTPASAVDYWPIVDHMTWNYGTSAESLHSITMHVFEGGFSMWEPNPYFAAYRFYLENGDGDIEIVSCAEWNHYGLAHASFNPPLLFLDLPLEVGKIWESANTTGALRGEVLREEIVEVSAGSYQVMVVRIANVLNCGLFAGDYYLERAIGKVMHNGVGLYSITSPIAVESQAWGSLKALFR